MKHLILSVLLLIFFTEPILGQDHHSIMHRWLKTAHSDSLINFNKYNLLDQLENLTTKFEIKDTLNQKVIKAYLDNNNRGYALIYLNANNDKVDKIEPFLVGDGGLHGYKYIYYTKGTIKSIIGYSTNRVNGLERQFWVNGNINFEQYWKLNNLMLSLSCNSRGRPYSVAFYDNGELLASYKFGRFSKIKRAFYYLNGDQYIFNPPIR